MGLQEIISWYQKKIGTYDKQQWEKTVEQRILDGMTYIPMKSAKLKTELIDLDLVRGSSFPKAKPEHGLVTVTRLAILKLFFLPLYTKWWVQQTSPRIFAILLLLYVLQLFNIAVYCYNSSKVATADTEIVSISELLVPIVMMLLLSIIHSQIVYTNPGQSRTPPRKTRRSVRRKRRVQSNIRSRGTDSKQQETVTQNTEKNIKFCKRVRLRNIDNKESCRIRESASQFSTKTNLTCDDSGETLIAKSSNEVLNYNIEPTDEFVSVIKPEPSIECPIDNKCDNKIENENVENIVNENLPAVSLDDDGFESLTGNASSENGEDANTNSQKHSASDSSSNTNTQNFNSIQSSPNKEVNKTLCSKSDLNIDNTEIKETESLRTWWVHETLKTKTPRTQIRESLVNLHDSETDTDTHATLRSALSSRNNIQIRRRGSQSLHISCSKTNAKSGHESSGESDEEGDCETVSSPETRGSCPLLTEVTTSATEWIGVTTNSDDCSYSSELGSDSQYEYSTADFVDHPFAWEFGNSNVVMSPSCAASDRVSCTIWDHRDVKKADLSVLDISSAIIARVEGMPETCDYFYGGIILSIFLSLIPALCRLIRSSIESGQFDEHVTLLDLFSFITGNLSGFLIALIDMSFGSTLWERTIMIVGCLQRMLLSGLFFFLLTVAERIFKQRFLYAKLFSHLTSSRRARKSELPHFRLNKVRNIKTWLSVRSYLKKRGPQRSVDVIVSAAFIITLLLLSFLSVELLRDSENLHSQYNIEVLAWSFGIGMFLLRFMTLGTKINKKYRNLSVLITEQINLYLQIEQKPKKKEEFMVANSVLKLAADLLKELECPFKISGLSANPYLYTITKVVILSALSAILSEMLGFKLKLHKIKIK